MTRAWDQTEVFSQSEGDQWFARNRHALGIARGDHVIDAARRWGEHNPIASVCELGCANGWRLASLRESLPDIKSLAGSDLSEAAIADGLRRWPWLQLTVGGLDQPNVQGQFDLVIVSFVFHWVAREKLAASVAGVDSLVRHGGALILADFLPDGPCARRYHHRDDVEVYTFKQDYARCFTGLGLYEEVARDVFAHSGEAGARIDPQDRAMCALLRKDLAAYERT